MFKSVKFVTSVANKKDILEHSFPEVAFVGRSNVGKSSIINLLTNRKNLAKTSSTPGKTKLINYFFVDESFYLVDLPGYGYSKTGKEASYAWGELLEAYLKEGKNLKAVYVLLDIRHKPSDKDHMMINFLYYYHIPMVFVLTKADKLSNQQQSSQSANIATSLKVTKNDLIITSAENKLGAEKLEEDILRRIKA